MWKNSLDRVNIFFYTRTDCFRDRGNNARAAKLFRAFFFFPFDSSRLK